MNNRDCRHWSSALLPGLMLSFAASALAQNEPTPAAPVDPLAGQEVQEREERQTLMSEKVYKRLNQVHEDLAENDLAGAQDKLRDLEDDRLNNYEKALVFQSYGFLFAQKGEYRKSIEYFERCLALDALPNLAQQGMLYSLASLYASEDQWQKTVATLTTWFKFEKEPSADAYILMGSALVQLKRFNEALPYVQTAISRSDDPKESWFQLELSIYLDQDQYQKAIDLLRKMVVRWPDKAQYWEYLAGSYSELKKDREALAAMMLAYHRGLLEKESQYLHVVRLNLYVDNPYLAGKILEKEIAAGHVKPEKKTLELLLIAWQNAKEFDKAIATIDKLGPLSSDGEIYLQKATLYSERARWPETIEAANEALRKGGLKKPGGAYLLIGIANTELGNWDQAIAAFEEARRFDANTRDQARDWMEFLKDRRQSSGP